MSRRYRCIDCGQEGDVVSGMTGCPACGSRAIPADPATDGDWTLSRWQWRLLLTAAQLWAVRHDDQSPYMRVFVARMWKLILDDDVASDVLFEVVRVAANVHANAERSQQQTARFSPHELRCLTIWGAWYVEGSDEADGLVPDSEFEPILIALRRQQSEPFALTFRDEIDEVRAAGYNVEIHEGPIFNGEDGG